MCIRHNGNTSQNPRAAAAGAVENKRVWVEGGDLGIDVLCRVLQYVNCNELI